MASISTKKRLCAAKKSPNWLEMPHEVMSNILERLDDVEILNSASKVCTTWRRIGRDPAMWKVINMHKPAGARDDDYDLHALTKEAVSLSCGELIDISLDGFGNDNLLDHILQRSSKLKSLSLKDCYHVTSERLNHALKMVPQLEKLHITDTSSVKKLYEVTVPNCPHLKSFKLDKVRIHIGIRSDIDALAIANTMPELRHLQLYGNAMSDIRLKAILDGCPHLESVDIRTCYNVDIHADVLKPSLERLKSFKGPNDSIENCGFHLRIIDYDDPTHLRFREYLENYYETL